MYIDENGRPYNCFVNEDYKMPSSVARGQYLGDDLKDNSIYQAIKDDMYKAFGMPFTNTENTQSNEKEMPKVKCKI